MAINFSSISNLFNSTKSNIFIIYPLLNLSDIYLKLNKFVFQSGSREYSLGYNLMEQLYSVLNSTNFNDDVIIDDRYSWTIGKRLVEARRLGYPYIIVAGRGVSKSPPVLELYQLYENQENNCTEETFESLVDKLNNFTKTNEEPKKNIFAM